MARPRKSRSASDPFTDLARKTEILEREMSAQRAAIERLKQLGMLRPSALPADETPKVPSAKRRTSR